MGRGLSGGFKLGNSIWRASRKAEKKNYVNRCNECGKLFAKTVKWPQTCPKCGSRKHETVSKAMIEYEQKNKKIAHQEAKRQEKAKKPTLPNVSSIVSSSVAICKNCRNTLKPTAKFCGSCGTRIA